MKIQTLRQLAGVLGIFAAAGFLLFSSKYPVEESNCPHGLAYGLNGSASLVFIVAVLLVGICLAIFHAKARPVSVVGLLVLGIVILVPESGCHRTFPTMSQAVVWLANGSVYLMILVFVADLALPPYKPYWREAAA